MNNSLEGIILSIKDYREYDVILQVLTKDVGIQSFVARGIRKLHSKNAAVCQRFTQAIFYVDYKETQTIHAMRTADMLQSYRKLREDLTKQSIASVLCDMIITFYQEEETVLYETLSFIFDKLNNSSKPYAAASLCLVKLLDLQGMKPDIEHCVSCGRLDDICAFSASDGGFICSHCYHSTIHQIESKINLKCFRLLVLCDLDNYDILEQFTEWNFHHFEALYLFFEKYSGIQLKSMKFLRNIENMK